MLLKIPIETKKALNKSGSKLNFVRESPGAHMSISPQSRVRGLERFHSLKNNNVQKQESRLTLWLDTDKNTIASKKV